MPKETEPRVGETHEQLESEGPPGNINSQAEELRRLIFDERISLIEKSGVYTEETEASRPNQEAEAEEPKGPIKSPRKLSFEDQLKMIESGQVDLLLVGFDSEQGVFRKALDATQEELKNVDSRIDELASDEKVLSAFQKKMGDRLEIIQKALEITDLRHTIDAYDLADDHLLAKTEQTNTGLTKADQKLLEQNKKLQKACQERITGLEQYDGVWSEEQTRNYLSYRQQIIDGRIVETPSVGRLINLAVSHLELGIPVILRGHLATGKTEDARHIAQKYLGQEPEIFSGSEEASAYDLIAKTGLGKKSEKTAEQRIAEYEFLVKDYILHHPNVSDGQIDAIKKTYYSDIVENNQTVSFTKPGPLLRAMKEGRPLIIDEIDAIPHSMLIRINDILTRRPGDKVRIQEDSEEEITITPGFCVMATANIKGAKYKREELDPAFLSRWWSTEVPYLPENETLDILVSSLLDKRGNLKLASSQDVDSLKRLVKYAKETQDIFAGIKTDFFGIGGDPTTRKSANLEKSVLSMRDLWNVVKIWKTHNFEKPLDDYIYSEFITKTVDSHDQIYLVQLACRFGFFANWAAEKFNITGINNQTLEGFKATTK
jgi:MoxR-like ATPase